MRIVAAVVAALILFYFTGVRITTADAKHDAEIAKAELVQEQAKNKKLEKELTELKIRYDELLRRMDDVIEYFERQGLVPEATYGGPLLPNAVRIPGSNDNDDDGEDETRIIERNNTTTNPPIQNDNNDNDDGDNNPPLVDAPDLPDVGDTKDDLLRDTPLEGVL